MATTGWLGEQTVHEWGGWGTRFTTNVYISGIRRYSDHVDVSGTIYLYCKSNGAYSVWYDWNITSWSMGNNLGQIKERTYTNNILNRSWGKNFTVRINCSNSATSATFNAGFSDSNMGGRDKYWTIYFDRYATAPSGITSTSSYTEYSTITTSCSGIKWGQGYSNRKLTCTASYTFNGKTENFTLGTWTDGATSKTVTKNDFNFPADLNVSIKWVASTNVGSTTSSSQVRVGQTYPAPNLSEVSFEGNSPSTYKLNATVTGINYGENYSKREAKLYFDYTLDGISYSTLLSSISDGSTSITVEYDATTESEPWKFIPDDEKGILRLVVDNGHRTSTKSSAQIYCQPQYEAYIVESIPDSEKEKSETYTGKNIQIQDSPKDAPLADFKLKGNTEQKSYTGKNLFNAQATPTFVEGNSSISNVGNGSFTISSAKNNTQDDWSAYCEYTLTLEPNTQYTLSKKSSVSSGTAYRFAGGLRTHIGITYGVVVDDDSITFTTDSTGIVGLIFYSAYIDTTKGQVSTSVKFENIQVEAGSTATTYEPYVGGVPSPSPSYPQNINVVTGTQTVSVNGTNYTVNLGDIELCKLDTYHQDYIYKSGSDWKVHKAIAHEQRHIETLAGIQSNAYVYGNNTTSNGAFCIIGTWWGNDYSSTLALALASTKLGKYKAQTVEENVDANSMLDGTFCPRSGTNDRLYFRFANWSGSKTVDEVKAALNNSGGVDAWYHLATPTDTVITDSNLIAQLEAIRTASLQNGMNNIMNIAIAPNLAGDMEIRYYTKWQDTFPATLYSNGKNGTGQFKQIRRIGTK